MGKLGWVEFGRGCAAFVVLLAHGYYADVPIDQYGHVFLWGRWGVCFFFVLSGFIIAHVHWQDLGTPERAGNFWWRRFIRIFPTYWLALVLYIFVRNVLGNADHRVDASALNVLSNLVMWPGLSDMLLPMAWTLRHEFLFYGLFSVAILNVRLGALLFAAWFALLLWTVANQTPCQMLTIASSHCMAINAANPDQSSPLWRLLTLNVNLYFFVGIALAYALRARCIGIAASIMAAATGLAFVVQFSTGSVYALAASQALVISAIVAGLIWLSTVSDAPRLALWFGAVSYPLYLFHMTMMLIAHGLVKRAVPEAPWPVTFVTALVLAFSIAHAVTFWFEPIFRNRSTAKSNRELTASAAE